MIGHVGCRYASSAKLYCIENKMVSTVEWNSKQLLKGPAASINEGTCEIKLCHHL